MATNEILQFAETDTGTNLLTQAEYLADAQRPIGNQPGVARSKLVNKALRQASLIAAGLAEYIAGNQANNVTDALTPQNIADYLQAAIRRLIDSGGYKASVRVATTANIALSGEQTIDDVAVVAGDRVLVMAQTAGAENGIYVAATGAWARAEDANGAGDLTSGVLVPVESGTANADTIWMLTTDGAITIGTTALTWQIKSGDASDARKGLVQLATSAEVQAGTDALKAVTAAGLLGGLLGAGGVNANDYVTIPFRDKTTGARRNLIVQWGSTTTSSTADTAITFPIAFPNSLLSLVGTEYTTAASTASSTAIVALANSTITGFDVGTYDHAGTRIADGAKWIALGY